MIAARSSITRQAIVRAAAFALPLLAIAAGPRSRAQDVIVVEGGGAVVQRQADVAVGEAIVEGAPPGAVEAEAGVVEGPGGFVAVELVPADAAQVVEGVAIADAQPAQVLTPEEQLRQAVDQQAAQFEPLFRSELNSQLDLIRTLQGDIPAEARRGIVNAGEKAAKEAARRTSEIVHAPQRAQIQHRAADAGGIVAGVVRGFLGLNRPRPQPQRPADVERFDGIHHVAAALADSLEEQVGDAAARAFEAEMARRDERRRQAVVHKVVALLDDDLCLTSEQAEAIGEALLAQWDESLVAATGMNVMNGDRRVYPGLPRALVVPHLTAAQRERFGGADENDTEQMYRQHWGRMGQINRLQRVTTIDRDAWWPYDP